MTKFMIPMLFLLFQQSRSLELFCKKYHSQEYGITCEFNEVNITVNDENAQIEIEERLSSPYRAVDAEYLLFTDSIIESIPRQLLAKFEKIKTLGFDNCVVDINDNKSFFKNIRPLKNLVILNSNILKVTKETFKYLTSIEELVLNYNRITKLTASSFENNKKLKKLHLSDNKINSIEPKLFEDLRLDFVDLRDNDCAGSFITNPNSNNNDLAKCFRKYESEMAEQPSTTSTTRIPRTTTSRQRSPPSTSTPPNQVDTCVCSDLESRIAFLEAKVSKLEASLGKTTPPRTTTVPNLSSLLIFRV